MSGTPAVREWFLRFEKGLVSRRGALHGALARVKAPLRAAREARYGVSRYASQMQAPERPANRVLQSQLFRSNLSRRIDSEAFYTFALYRKDRWHRQSLYVSRVEGTLASRLAVHLLYSQQARLLSGKHRFDRWADELKLPMVQALGSAEDGNVVWATPDNEPVPERDMFIKRTVGYGGVSTMQALWRGDTFDCSDGTQRSPGEMLRYLRERSVQEGLLIQPLLVNHPDVRRLSVRSLNTLRITTCSSMSGDITTISGALRMAMDGATADNIGQGGLAARVDLETGRLGKGVRLQETFDEQHFSRHPTTGHEIAGTIIPFWKEARELAERAHSLLGTLPSVAWDIAVLPEGPILVEGNWNGDTWIPQVAGDTLFFTTVYDESYATPLAKLVDALPDEEFLRLGELDPRVSSAAPEL